MNLLRRFLNTRLFWTFFCFLCKTNCGKSYAGSNFSKVASSSLGAELLLVQTIFRHGERNPQFLMPADKQNKLPTWFQESLGELTPKGMKQIFSLGQQFVKRYRKFVNPNVAARQVYMRSTDRNRTLTSAAAFLSGFTTESLKINGAKHSQNSKYYQPIPVHTIYGPTDSVVLVDTYCAKATQILENEVHKEHDWIKKVEENKNLIAWLGEKSGIQNLTLDQLWKIIDPLTIEKHYPNIHRWPDWANSSLYEQIDDLVDFVTLRKYHRKSLARLRGGQLLGEIVNRMDHKISCASKPNLSSDSRHCAWINNLKFYFYSAHESTILALLETLARNKKPRNSGAASLTEGSFPRNGATLILELWRDGLGRFFVKILYKNQYKAGLVPVWVSNGCSSNGQCSFQKFQERSVPFIPENWDKECQVSEVKSGEHEKKFRSKKDAVVGIHSYDFSYGSVLYNLSISPPVNYVPNARKPSNTYCPQSVMEEVQFYKRLTVLFGALLVLNFSYMAYIRRCQSQLTRVKVDE